MRSADVRPPARSLALALASIVVLAATPASMLGQGQTGTVAGHVVDSAGAPLAADISVFRLRTMVPARPALPHRWQGIWERGSPPVGGWSSLLLLPIRREYWN